jgi:mono/diheme cytochrome c family protein
MFSNSIKITFFSILAISSLGCHSTKKSIASTPASTTTPVPSNSNPFPLVLPVEGSPAPGNEELIAIQKQYQDITLEKLKEGHTIYTAGACINCHGAAPIQQYGETQWKTIIDDMAQRANISEAQKDAVYKYVLSIKATQTK